MKIISKHKDCYDYLTGIYGIDPVLVYDRRTLPIEEFSPSRYSTDEITQIYIHLNGKKYMLLVYKDKIHVTPDEIFELMVIRRKTGKRYFLERSVGRGVNMADFLLTKKWNSTYTEMENVHLRKMAQEFCKKMVTESEENVKHRQPVLFKPNSFVDNWKIPILSTFNFHKVLDIQTIYQEISEFLGWMNDNPEAPQITDDKVKIVEAGFDLKTSFRPKIKK